MVRLVEAIAVIVVPAGMPEPVIVSPTAKADVTPAAMPVIW